MTTLASTVMPTSKDALISQASRYRLDVRNRLGPDHLDGDLALPGPVELREDDRLKPPEGEVAVVHAEGHGAAEEGGPEVRVAVAALAVREAGIVVTVAAALGDQLFDQALEIVHEGALELVDEDRAGRMQGVDQGDPRRNGGLLDGFPDELRDVGDLGAFLTVQRERGVEDHHPLSLPRGNTVF